MKMNFSQIQNLMEVSNELSSMKLPFKLSLIIAKNLTMLNKEFEFFVEQERNFINSYIEKNEDGSLVTTSENMYKIKLGMEQECADARKELDQFETEVRLRMIPVSLLENLELTPKQVQGLEIIIEEE